MGIGERRSRELKRREEDILSAAVGLLDRDDWQSVTIDQIAAEAEVGKGTVYKHFESKDHIYAVLAARCTRGFVERLRGLDPGQPALGYIEKAMDSFLDYHKGAPQYSRLLHYCRRPDFRRQVGEKGRREIEAVDEEFMGLVAPVLERGRREGALVDKPVSSLLSFLHSVLFGFLEMADIECVHCGGLPAEKMFAEVKGLALRAVARR